MKYLAWTTIILASLQKDEHLTVFTFQDVKLVGFWNGLTVASGRLRFPSLTDYMFCV